MAISTYMATLKYGAASADTPVSIKSFPAILAPRTALETTTMADDARTYIQGIRDVADGFEFTANWDADTFEAINGVSGEQFCELEFSDGSSFAWKGYISASNSGGGVNEVIEMTITITPSTVPVFSK